MLTAIILASGYSKRFNKNKLLIKINDRPLVEITLQEVCDSNFDEVILIYREDEVKEIGLNYDVFMAYNKNAHLGMSEAVKIGVSLANDKADGYMFFVADQPFLSHKVINEIIDDFYLDKSSILIPVYDAHKCNPVCFPRKYYDELLSISGDEGGRQIISKVKEGKRLYE
ncbi:MAG: nucleotidyltransferase family protein, partial [Clostridiales bacterium]|nr:nucleotidyltransferase family protein [Clostridiales bacterium]